MPAGARSLVLGREVGVVPEVVEVFVSHVAVDSSGRRAGRWSAGATRRPAGACSGRRTAVGECAGIGPVTCGAAGTPVLLSVTPASGEGRAEAGV
ncbi:hypothetical protein GCM10019016_051700 [Streptomyces prasinosporus]|uniref:Uncharacterized protein n=1 Tax=Streptomyces prasinosporus TaxID=68256 RepID=A0ABP6TS06_9ACTN